MSTSVSSAAKTLLAWSIQTAVAMGFYLLFAGKFSWHELVVGGCASALAGTLSEIVRRRGVAFFEAGLDDVVQIWRLPGYMVADTYEVLAVLFRQLILRQPAGSHLLAVPFDPDGDDSTQSARRALVTAYGTATPKYVILGVDTERKLLVFHQLRPTPLSKMLVRLGAKRAPPRPSRPTPRPNRPSLDALHEVKP